MRRVSITFLLVIAFAMPLLVKAQQGGQTNYVYDDNGRLRAVISPTGEATVFDYDAAGNFIAIRRLSANALELFSFFPKAGVPGDRVTFIGVGFGVGVNSVSFNGTLAQVIQTTPSTVIAEVPQGATTGPVTITTPIGSVTTPVPFVVRGVIVSPATATVLSGYTVQFTATVIPGGNQNVQWSSLNGGTITNTGLYTAPSLQSNQPAAIFIVRATSTATPGVFGEAQVTVRNPNFTRTALGAGLLVQYGTTQPLTQPAISAGLLVQRNTSDSPQLQPAISAGLLVQLNAAGQQQLQPAISVGVTVTNAPNITSIAPNTLIAGTATNVTITGANFGGTTALRFIKNDGTNDTGIVASNLNVNANGTSLTVTLTVNSSVTAGTRIVIITTATGASQVSNVGANVIQITTAANKNNGGMKPKRH
jgi:YD repeat-containing protein